jgi:hypothetical protein
VRFNPVSAFIALAIVVAIAGASWLFATNEAARHEAARRVANSPSEIRLRMMVHHRRGPIVEEDYKLADIDGLSTSEYRGVGRNGTAIKVSSQPRQTYDVAFFFDRAVSDGIWELPSRPPRGDTATAYTIGVYQLTNSRHGSHAFSFTDPHYWATTGGHQFHIKLDRNKPVPNLLELSSTTLVEQRYERLVDGFRTFGSEAFRAEVAATRARLGGRT